MRDESERKKFLSPSVFIVNLMNTREHFSCLIAESLIEDISDPLVPHK